MKHTQGKWEVKPTGTELYSYVYSGDIRIAEIKSYGKDDKFNDPSIEEREANAKLIAAAPELYDFCVKVFQLSSQITMPTETEINELNLLSNELIGKVLK